MPWAEVKEKEKEWEFVVSRRGRPITVICLRAAPNFESGAALRWNKNPRALDSARANACFLRLKAGAVLGKDRERSSRKSAPRGARETHLRKPFEADFIVSWTSEERDGENARVSFQTVVTLDLAGAFALLALKPGEPKNRISLLKMFSDAVAQRFKSAIERRGYGRVTRLRGKMDGAVFDEMMEQLRGQGLIEESSPPQYVRHRAKYWKLTKEGVARLAQRALPPQEQ